MTQRVHLLMAERKLRMSSRELITSALFAAVVCAATLVIRIPVPATSGYINLGDSMVFVSALLFGARIGGIAGGVGSALADILAGYGWYAPATLIIKGTEGFVAGHVSRFGDAVSRKAVNVLFSVIIVLVGLLGLYIFRNAETATLEAALKELNVLLVIGGLYVLFVSLKIPYSIVAVIAGGIIMITGYFLVQAVVFGPPAAITELPGNIFQAGSGLVIAVPVVKAIKRALPERF